MKPSEKPLFIPLKTEFFAAFASGEKTVEFRPYGARWNERTCAIGREVVLSCGYGKSNRLRGVIYGFERSAEPTKSEAWRKCYGDRFVGDAACIHIRLIDEAVGCGDEIKLPKELSNRNITINGVPVPDVVNELICIAVTTEREACANLCERYAFGDGMAFSQAIPSRPNA